jgi:methylated-DNA-[protein]-cysteine S-methyltransferase
MKKLFTHKFKTRIGWFHLAETERGVAVVDFPRKSSAFFDAVVKEDYKDRKTAPGGIQNRRAERQIKAYLDGRLQKFSVKLDINGGEFQKKALRRVRLIPYGKTATYGQIAASLGSPRAARAVGSANARNRLPILIPCHRVVASKGIGGYAAGLKLKKFLLDLEKQNS